MPYSWACLQTRGCGELPRLHSPSSAHAAGRLPAPHSPAHPAHSILPQHPPSGLRWTSKQHTMPGVATRATLGRDACDAPHGRSHYRALSQWASYLSAFQLHGGCFSAPKDCPGQSTCSADSAGVTFSETRAAASRRQRVRRPISAGTGWARCKAPSHLQHHLREHSAVPHSLPQVGSLEQPALTDILTHIPPSPGSL